LAKVKYENIKQIDPITNEVLNVFGTIREASKYLNVTKANNITGVLNGDRAKAYGFKWEL